MKRRMIISIGTSMLVLAILACALPSAGPSPTTSSGGGGDLALTQTAIAIKQTEMAMEATRNAGAVPTMPPVPTAGAAATYTPYPTYTVPAPTNPPPPPLATATDSTSLEDKIRNANVLVFEDIRGYPALLPYVHNVVGNMGLRKAKEVGDALGNFQREIYSPTKWDLIIVAAEVRSAFSGEMFDGVIDRLNDGAAVVIELWHMDRIINGKIAPLVGKCGVGLHKNWERPLNFDPLNYSMYWLDTSSPIISQPNSVSALYSSVNYWIGDAGDLMDITGGDAEMLAGLYPREHSSYGTLAVCMGGRMIVQTFSTHDYPQSQTSALWENYIYNTLKAHFEYIE